MRRHFDGPKPKVIHVGYSKPILTNCNWSMISHPWSVVITHVSRPVGAQQPHIVPLCHRPVSSLVRMSSSARSKWCLLGVAYSYISRVFLTQNSPFIPSVTSSPILPPWLLIASNHLQNIRKTVVRGKNAARNCISWTKPCLARQNNHTYIPIRVKWNVYILPSPEDIN